MTKGNNFVNPEIPLCPGCGQIPFMIYEHSNRDFKKFQVEDISLYNKHINIKNNEDIYCNCGQVLFYTDEPSLLTRIKRCINYINIKRKSLKA